MLTDPSWCRWGGEGFAGWPGVSPATVRGQLGEPIRLRSPVTAEEAAQWFLDLEARVYAPHLGWISYELGPLADSAMGSVVPKPGTVLAEFWPLQDPEWTVGFGSSSGAGEQVTTCLERWRELAGNILEGLSLADRKRYEESVRRLQSGMERGDWYEANLTTRFRMASSRAPGEVARDLFDHLDPHFGSVIAAGDSWIISASPELFLRRQGERLVTRPIKGSARRSARTELDAQLARELADCPKNRAEHLMVVDLSRNDLGRICKPGSVRVVDFQRVETHPAVHHLVSTVEGVVAPKTGLWEILQATWPAASITGCPKVAVTRALAQEECSPRGVYTGAVGLLMPGGDFQLNVAIRTLQAQKSSRCGIWDYEFGSGGAVVADSIPSEEWAECLMKAQPLCGVLLDLGMDREYDSMNLSRTRHPDWDLESSNYG